MNKKELLDKISELKIKVCEHQWSYDRDEFNNELTIKKKKLYEKDLKKLYKEYYTLCIMMKKLS